MKHLHDKVAVITGAGSGIGRAIALALADAGTHVVAADIQPDKAQAVAAEVASRGVRSLAVACDVSRPDALAALADQSFGCFGRVDILCNNAGTSIRPYRGIAETTLKDWQFLYGINFWGVVHGLHAFLPRMRQQDGDKHIVNTASLAGMLPMEAHAIYSSSKAAVVNLSEALSRELSAQEFGVTILCPGPVKTDLQKNIAAVHKGIDTTQSGRSFEQLPMPTLDFMGRLHMPSAQEVGTMVRNAILDGTLYLHTAPLPDDLVSERQRTLYGEATLGRLQP